MDHQNLFRIIITWPDGSRLIAGEHLTIVEAVYLRKRLVCWGIDEVAVEPERLPAARSWCSGRVVETIRRLLTRFFPSLLPR